MHFPKKEKKKTHTLSAGALSQASWQPTPWPGPDTQLWKGPGRGGEGREHCLIVDHSCWVLYAVLRVCVLCVSAMCASAMCVCCVCVCLCCVYGESVKSWCALFNLPSAYRLPCGCSRRVFPYFPPTVPPPLPLLLCRRPRALFALCAVAYKSHKSVREAMSKQAVNMFV